MAFDPDKYLAETDEDQQIDDTSFDPDKYLAEPEEVMSEEPSALEAGIAGVARGGTLGFSDEIAGAMQAGMRGVDELTTAVGLPEIFAESGSLAREEQLEKSGLEQKKDLLETYRAGRKEQRQREEQLEEAQPGAFLAGEIAGGLATPGLGVAKTASKVGKVAKLAGVGGAAGLGTSEADITQGELGQAAQDVAEGAAMGVLIPKAMEKVGAAGSKIIKSATSKALKGKAGRKAMEALGASKRQLKKDLGATGRLGDEKGAGKELLGNFLDDQGKKKPILSLREGPEELVENISKAQQQNRDKIQPLFDQIQQRVDSGEGINLEKFPQLADSLEESFKSVIKDMEPKLKKQLGGKRQFGQIKQLLDDFVEENRGLDFDVNGLNELKRELGQQLSDPQWLKSVTGEGGDLPQAKQLIRQMYGIAKKRIEDLGDALSNPGEKLGQEIKDLNMQFSNLIDASVVAKDEATRKLPTLTLKDLFIGGGLLNVLDPVSSAAIVGSKALIEKGAGRRMGNMAQIAQAKVLSEMSNALESMNTTKAAKMAGEIKRLIGLPIQERAGALTQVLKNPENSETIRMLESRYNNDKPANKQAMFINSSKEALSDISSKFGDDRYAEVLRKAADTQNAQQRKAMLYGLMQRPDFRQKLERVEDEGNDNERRPEGN